ncbi:MAG: hypothetical protein QW695_01535 [Candidatus Bathyarchaeia archaeon]
MVVEVRGFERFQDFIESIDSEVTRLKALLGDYMRRVESVKARAEKHLKVQGAISKIAKKKLPEGEVIDLKGVEALINPSPKQELDILLEAMQSVQDRINQLENIKKSVSVFQEAQSLDIPIEVVYRDGIPKTIIVRM